MMVAAKVSVWSRTRVACRSFVRSVGRSVIGWLVVGDWLIRPFVRPFVDWFVNCTEVAKELVSR